MNLGAIERNAYDYHLRDPSAWLMVAWQLNRAASEIDQFSLPGFSNGPPDGPRGEIAWLMPVYRFLIGQSFENLLKGLLIAQGTSAGATGQLDEQFGTHSLSKLLPLVDRSRFSISAAEERALIELELYVLWAGRYPIPKRASLYRIALGYSDSQHRTEKALWSRMYSYAKSCNVKCPTDSSDETTEMQSGDTSELAV